MRTSFPGTSPAGVATCFQMASATWLGLYGLFRQYHFYKDVSAGGIRIGAYLMRLFSQLLSQGRLYTWYLYFQAHCKAKTALRRFTDAYM